MLSVCFPQLVVLPYQVLLHEATRRAAGVQLEGQARMRIKLFIIVLFLL